jgi:hypothetical protein
MVVMSDQAEENIRAHYPIAIVEDRYGGGYAGGNWLAISQADLSYGTSSRVDFVLSDKNGPHSGDIQAREFWAVPPDWIVAAGTPNDAVAKLARRLPTAIDVDDWRLKLR